MAQGVRTPLAERSDDQLAALAAQGDEQAFGELYQRYFRGLYDFTLRTLRDREAASDVVQSTFVKAWAGLRSPKGVENVKAWLYAVARNLAIDELRRRQRVASPRSDSDEQEDPIYTIVDESRLADPSIAAHDQELVDLVWESAAALSPSEYSLLDLHLRQGLDADELSEALGVAKGAVYTRLTRLRDSLDEAVTSSVLMKQARRDCEELDALLTRMNATELTRQVKKAITEHAKDCEICGEVKRRLITPAELFAGLTLVPIPAGLMEAIWHGISTELGFAGAGAVAAGHGGHGAAGHAAKSSRHATKVKAATALGTLGAVAIIGALLFPRAGAVEDPSDVHSTTHSPGAAAVVPVVNVAWTPRNGADAYSVSWTAGGQAEPDAVGDLPGSAGGVSSPALGPGRWWFNLRTRDHGDWTHTVHIGPFVIVGSTIQAALIPVSAY
ncbi:MAG: RNA polymerase sigma factor, partial [Gaiellaceae bacterium]